MLPRSVAFVFAVLLPFLPAFAAERVFVLDSDATKATFSLDTTLHLVHGSLAVQSGEIRFDLETGLASGEIFLDARRTETGNQKRDRKMHAKVLESEPHPVIVFRPQSVGGNLPDAGHGALDLEGVVSIAGGDHPLTLHAEVEVNGDHVSAETRFMVPYVEWGMFNPSLFILRVAKTVEVTVNAQGSLGSP